MERRTELKQGIAANTKNVRPEPLDRPLLAYGLDARRPRGGSSHTMYRYSGPAGILRITVPKRFPFLLRAYVDDALALIEQIESVEKRAGSEPDHGQEA